MSLTKSEKFRRQFCLRLKSRRASRGLTQAELAKLAKLQPMQISQYENGHVRPNLENLADLATAMGCTTDYFLSLRDTPV